MANTNHSTPHSELQTPHSDEAEQRRARRLAQVLGINQHGIEVVLRMRRQMLTLQALVRQLEGELKTERARTRSRFIQYRSEYHEATWKDADR